MSVNISQAMNSPSYAHKLWLNYYYGDNTMDISASVIGRIEAAWGEDSGYNYIAQWERTAAMDNNEYEIPDDDFENFKEQGYEEAKSSTGYENSTGDKIGQQGRVIADASVSLVEGGYAAYHTGKGAVSGLKSLFGKGAESAASTTGGTVAQTGGTVAQTGGTVLEDQGKLILGSEAEVNPLDGLETVTEEGTKKGAEETAKTASNGGTDWFLIAACAINAAVGALALIFNPNEKQYKAVMDSAELMGEQMSLTQDKQSEMEKMSQELTSAADEAAGVNEEANTQINDEKTKYDLYKTTYDYLAAKNEAARTGGEPLNEDEKALFKEVSKYMAETGDNITKAQDDASAKVSDIHSDMETYQAGFDSAAETIAATQGVTEYAAGFDEATKTACVVEAVSQGTNAASSGVNLARAGIKLAQSFGVWPLMIAYGAAAAAALSGVITSGMAALKQWTYVKGDGSNAGINGELALRSNTEKSNVTTQETYDTEVKNFAQNVGAVENLELTLPDDTEAPESIEFADAQSGRELEEDPRRTGENA